MYMTAINFGDCILPILFTIDFTNILADHAASVILSAIGGGAQAALPHTQQRERADSDKGTEHEWFTCLSFRSSNIFVKNSLPSVVRRYFCRNILSTVEGTSHDWRQCCSIHWINGVDFCEVKHQLQCYPCGTPIDNWALWSGTQSSTPGFIHKWISVFKCIMNDLMTLS